VTNAAVPFAKGHGTENDFVLLLDPDGLLELTASTVATLCDRHAGLAADGLIRVVRSAALEDGADCVILGGAGLAGIARGIAAEVPVPLLDGLDCAVRQAELLAALAPLRPPPDHRRDAHARAPLASGAPCGGGFPAASLLAGAPTSTDHSGRASPRKAAGP
jgi:hypothetical protein